MKQIVGVLFAAALLIAFIALVHSSVGKIPKFSSVKTS